MSPTGEESRRTAFRAAFLMGDEGRELFLWLARQDDPVARRAAVLSLYLHWRRDRAYVFDLMDTLADLVGLPPIGRSGRALRFLADLSITVYINHPEDGELVQRTSELWSTVLIRRLHLDRFLFLVRGPLGRQIGRAFAARTLDTALLSEVQPPKRFFGQSDDERARFLRVVPLVDPDAPLHADGQAEDLVGLLESDILLHRVLGALVLAIHAAADPGGTARLLDGLRPRLGGEAALWALLAFSVPLPGTPDAWVPLVEGMTRDLVKGDRDAFFGERGGLLGQLDIGLLPLGLAYGKRGLDMPLVDELLGAALRDDRALALRIVRGLGSVGFYYPHSVFTALRPYVSELLAPDAIDTLGRLLGTMRVLHFDAVDLFLGEIHAPESLRATIAGDPESGLIERCINWIGFYNNAVHQALFYPAMRRTLLVGGLTALGRARKPSDFIGPYTDAIIDMGDRAGFRLARWTDPAFDAQPGTGTDGASPAGAEGPAGPDRERHGVD